MSCTLVLLCDTAMFACWSSSTSEVTHAVAGKIGAVCRMSKLSLGVGISDLLMQESSLA